MWVWETLRTQNLTLDEAPAVVFKALFWCWEQREEALGGSG